MLFVVSVANIFNLGADIGAMGAAMQLLLPKTAGVFTVIFGVASLAGVMLVPYSTYTKYLKWLTLSLFAYVGVVFFAHVSWQAVLHATVLPHLEPTKEYLTALIAVLGTTISPYLFFWQASQEVEEVRNNRGEKPLKHAPSQAKEQLGRIHLDTYLGMAFSNIVAFFIILTAAATLHAHGITGLRHPRRRRRHWSRWRGDSPSRFSSAELSAQGFWRYLYLPHPPATEWVKPAAGKPALSESPEKRSGFTLRSRLQR